MRQQPGSAGPFAAPPPNPAAPETITAGPAQRQAYETLTYAGDGQQQNNLSAMSETATQAIDGMETSVYIPLANLPETMRFELDPGSASLSRVAGYLIEVTAYIDDELQAAFDLQPAPGQPPAAVAIRYTDADVAGMDKARLRLFRQTGATWEAAACDGYAVQRLPQENRILVPVCQTGTFALADRVPAFSPSHSVYLPLLLR